MGNEKPTDLALQVLINIRDEIKGLREDTNRRFEKIEADISVMKADIGEMKRGINAMVSRFDRDYLLLATEVNGVKERLRACEQRLGIAPQNPS